MSERAINRWVILFYCALMQTLTIGIAIYAFAFFVVPWMQDYAVPRSTLLLAATGCSVMTALLSPVCGLLLDKYPPRRLVVGSALAYAAGLLCIALDPGYVVVILVFAGVLPFGMCLAGTLMAMAVVARLFTENRGLALGLVALGTSFGGLSMPLLVTTLLASFGWQTVYAVLAVLVLVLVVVPGMWLLPDSRPHASGQGSAHPAVSLATMRSRPVLMLGLAYLGPATLFIAILHNVGGLAVDLAISQQLAAWVTAGASISMAIGKVGVGALSDRVDQRVLYAVLALLITCGVVATSFAASFLGLLIGAALAGFVFGGASPLVASIVAARWGAAGFGRVLGVVYALAGLSGIGPFIAGLIRDVRGSYTEAFLWLLPVLVVALYCFLTVPKAPPLEALRPAGVES